MKLKKLEKKKYILEIFALVLVITTLVRAYIDIREIIKLQKIERIELVQKNKVLGITIQIASAIKHKESGGNYNAKGASGEIGAYQMMPSTYNMLSKKCKGKIVPPTPENQDKIVHCTIQKFVENDKEPKEIIQWWNSGSFDRCPKGVNKYGVKYDCPAYVQSVMSLIK